MITCFIRYEIEPFTAPAFEEYARTWGQAIPRCGADLIGYFAPMRIGDHGVWDLQHRESGGL